MKISELDLKELREFLAERETLGNLTDEFLTRKWIKRIPNLISTSKKLVLQAETTGVIKRNRLISDYELFECVGIRAAFFLRYIDEHIKLRSVHSIGI